MLTAAAVPLPGLAAIATAAGRAVGGAWAVATPVNVFNLTAGKVGHTAQQPDGQCVAKRAVLASKTARLGRQNGYACKWLDARRLCDTPRFNAFNAQVLIVNSWAADSCPCAQSCTEYAVCIRASSSSGSPSSVLQLFCFGGGHEHSCVCPPVQDDLHDREGKCTGLRKQDRYSSWQC